MVTVEDIRGQLQEQGMSEEETENIKGKANLQEKLNELLVASETKDLFLGVEVETEQAVLDDLNTIAEVSKPEMTSTKWAEFVLSHLEENEKIKGHPKADSLRRLTELLIGPILKIKTKVIQCPAIENGGRATVVVSVVVDSENGRMEASGAADVFAGNTEQIFARFPVATAETRAEGRAYRKMLRLINVVVAEELVDESQIYDPADKIEAPQLNMINTMCGTNRLNINVEELLKMCEVDVSQIENISKSKAKEVCKVINSYQSTEVPENLIGYQENWRS
tara:strand:+ start:440 stop:1279 length:840 start_codon:yes stop_codon:yes gene_type:complete